MLQFRVPFRIVLVLVLSFSCLAAYAANSAKKLPPTYQHWLETEVPYIINSDERKEFLSLESDTERDSFIDAFWRVRNPTPGSDTNSFKDEHYRRLAYANEQFGVAKYEDGWRTDMGKMYIVLGAPKQRAPYHALANIHEMEIWFYQSDTPVLPPFFYLLFYKPSPSEPYKLYSPRNDTPVRLVATGESRNDPTMALSILKKFAGDEVARTAVTLLPTESADLNSFQPSIESDALLNKLQSLPDNPFTKELLSQRRLQERVTTSILTGELAPDFSYGVFRDAQGTATLSYLLQNQIADPRLIEAGTDKTLRYDLGLRTTVLTADGKFVYEQDDELTGKVTETQAAVARQKRFGAEGRLPLTPGKYVIVATLTNNLNHLAIRQHGDVTVPPTKSGTIGISPLVAYTAPAAVPDANGTLPFSASKFRFTPRGAGTVRIRQGEKLPLVFQLWLDPRSSTGLQPSTKIHLRYVFGAVTAGHDTASTENEEVDPGNRDAGGNLLTGHTVDTSELTPGTYRLVVGANWDGAAQTTYATLTLRVEPSSQQLGTWTAFGGVAPDVLAVDDLKRGLSAEAQGEEDEAQRFYARALSEGPTELRSLDRLAALLARRGQTDALAALSQQPVLADVAATPKTLLLIAGALTKNGNLKGAVRLLETQIKLQPPSGELYGALAGAYEANGDAARARDVRALAAGIK